MNIFNCIIKRKQENSEIFRVQSINIKLLAKINIYELTNLKPFSYSLKNKPLDCHYLL